MIFHHVQSRKVNDQQCSHIWFLDISEYDHTHAKKSEGDYLSRRNPATPLTGMGGALKCHSFTILCWQHLVVLKHHQRPWGKIESQHGQDIATTR